MPFIIMWQDIRIGVLFGNEENVKYKIFFENLSKAKEKGLIINTILQYTSNGEMPNWINNRIPKNTLDKFEHLRQTQGRLETDDIWFQVA